ncbi:hypothetical protein L1987_33006 [Smallanthus sonchifolius]|uniref:Uncharacterized protein n=1 Tax=Smallanthus sonchifolius TaxID=185202 RepID=A0ACB9HQN1_9ASTR|nr:hypothetical protein L1987_33006 [Smallanthus sonchifolius]
MQLIPKYSILVLSGSKGESPPKMTRDKVPSESKAETEALDKRRLEEKFAVLNTRIYECRSCGYLYNEAAGDPSYPIAPGLSFDRFPEDWRCPTCGAAKTFFASKSVEIAGFAKNQQFGLGVDYLLFIVRDGAVSPDPDEVADIKYVNQEELKELLRKADAGEEGLKLSPWFRPSESKAETEAFDKRRLEEKFAVLNTRIYECRSCGYLYNEAAGDPSYR